jgi:uncharacterized protein (TIGR02598 family)
MNPRKNTTPTKAFSMVEVVLALGIMSFCIIALIGLFSVGVNTSKESAEEMLAAHIMQSLLTTRRAAPDKDLDATFPLPKILSDDAKSDILLDANGNITTTLSSARYRFSYRITGTSSNVAPITVVYLRLAWPAQATGGNIQGAYEITTNLPRPQQQQP